MSLRSPAGRVGPSFSQEEERIRTTYATRAGEPCYAESVAGRFQFQERERQVLQTLDRHGLLPLSGKRILEVGCGTGKWLRDLIAWGADPENVFGVELLQASATRARRLSPQAVTIECGNAAEMSFDSGSFDIVLQATVFSSVLDPAMKQAMAAEMLRVLRPGGLILWYDIFVRNPWNPYMQPIGKGEIRRLFPGCSFELRRIGLVPPLIRLVAPRSWLACSLMARVPQLLTHYLGAIRQQRIEP
jgi:ubiquinone/menaquinone biosynthesis C-methylase UbiE